MPDAQKATTSSDTELKALREKNEELVTANKALVAERDALTEELKQPVEFPDEFKQTILRLRATYDRIKHDGRLDSRELDELQAELDSALLKLASYVGG